MQQLGMVEVVPLRGLWPFQGNPPVIELGGRVFTKAVFAWPFYPGVVAQYRQDVPFNSAHLLVYADGTWVVSHLDRFNPDRGHALEHLLFDTPAPQVVGGFALGVGAVVALDALTSD